MRPIAAVFLVSLAACSPAEPPKTSASRSSTAASSDKPTESVATVTHEPQIPAQPVVLDRGDGLTVEVERAGQGVEVASASAVTLHYRAFVKDAEKPFDSSYEAGVPLVVQLGADAKPRVIDGLARGLIGLRAGTKAKLEIPAALGWGSAGNESAGVPKDSALVYEVELVDVR